MREIIVHFRWRPHEGRESVADQTESALLGMQITAQNRIGSEPCSALHCSAESGIACAYVDRRGRKCKTAWCPTDREVVGDEVYCRLHGHTMRGIEHEFGTTVHPDVGSRTVPIINWMAAAAADDIVATLNVLCYLRGEVLVSEPVRRVYHSVERTRIWEKQWKTLSTTGVTMRVCIASDEARPNEIHIRVNGDDVNVVPPPWNQALGAPNDADLEWLYQEVLVPIGEAVEQWMALQAETEGSGYVPPTMSMHHESEPALQGHGPEGWAATGGAVADPASLSEATSNGTRRGSFAYGLEEIQALRSRESDTA